jgi:outer membrane protein insertion porin family
VNIDYTDITAGLFPAQEITSFIQSEGSTFLNYTANLTWINSQLNRGLFPTRGSSQNLSAEVALPGSDLAFFKVRYEGQKFIPLGPIFTLRAHTKLGYGGAFGGSSTLPFYEHFFAGGFGSVRGFELNSLGPEQPSPRIRPSRVAGPSPSEGTC